MSRLILRLLLCLFTVTLAAVPLAQGAEWYVSPSGSAQGDGSAGDPWDLQTALNHPGSVDPGDTIWLRGGTYGGTFTCHLDGTSGSPIIVRSCPGEWAVLRAPQVNREPTLQVVGTYTWFWGFEVTCAGEDRISDQITSWPTDIDFATGFQAGNNSGQGIGCKAINLVVHNTCQALSLWTNAIGFETTGCLAYHSGWDAPDRGHGHNLYLQNETGTKLFRDNIAFGGFAYGCQSYGSADLVNNFTFEYNTLFNCGDDSNSAGGELMLAGGGDPGTEGIVLTGNMYFRNYENMGNGVRLGYASGNVDVDMQYNYFACGLKVNYWSDVTFRHNTCIGPRTLINPLNTNTISAVPAYDWDYNTYHCTETPDGWGHYLPFYRVYGGEYRHTWSEWRSVTGYDDNSSYSTTYPTSLVTVIRPSPYQTGYGSVTFFNWADSNSIDVDISSIIDPNQSYEIMDAQNYFGSALASGTYSSGSVSVPVTSTTAAQPTGNAPKSFSHTPKTFGVLIVRATSGGGAAPSAPAGLTASDGAYADKVALDWTDTSGATSYKVYRHTTDDSGSASQIGTPTASAFDDTTATPGSTYYYWVKASNVFGDSEFSSSETGYRFSGSAPSTPTGLTASDGTYTDKVALDWSDAAGATSYKVYRNTTNDSGTATQIGTPAASAFDDTTATPLSTYYYWVKASNPAGDSSFSSSETGYRGLNAPSAPTGLTATDGTHTDRVSLDWADTSGADSYKVYRHTTDDSGSASQLGTPTANAFHDTTAVAGSTYYYWVKASNAAGDSSFSSSDTGYRATGGGFVQYMEAESGSLTSPIGTVADANASGGYYIRTTAADSGYADFTIDAPSAGDYYVWGRVLCADYQGSDDSYYVSVDGGAQDVYDMAEGLWASYWQWTVVNGRGGGLPGTISPRVFNLSAGSHTFRFRGREVNSKLDRLCFTNESDYIPFDSNGPTPPPTPTGLTASDGTYSDKVALDWTDSSGAASYKVYRNTSDYSGTASQIGTPTASAFDDTTAGAGTTYYYWVKASGDAGDSGFSSSDSGYRAVEAPSAPTGLTASDGTYTDKVALDWADTSGAASYKVFRNTTSDSGSASQIGTPTASAFDDTTAVAGSTYYYWVKASNAGGDSGFSSSDTGYRAVGAPPTPTGLTASDGTYTDKVALDWADTGGATSYKVYRNTTDDSGSASQLSTPTASAYDDTTAGAGTTYYYWVKACNASGDSGFSSSDTGFRAAAPSTPTGLTASDGTYNDKVALDWADTSGAASYKVYRNTTDNSGSASQIGTPTASAFNDTTATPLTTYYYWVKASNAAGDSGFSSSDTGYRSDGGLAAPSDLTATDGTTASKVFLDWSNISGAGSYKIYRNTTSDSGSATQISTQIISYYEDSGCSANTTYYYWVKACDPEGDSDFSNSDTGWRAGLLSVPTGLTASDGTYSDKVAVDWDDKPFANSYKVYRNTQNNSGQATEIATPSASAYDDTTAVAGTTYYYWVKAHNVYGDSDFSSSETGYRATGGPPSAPTGLTASDGTYADKVALDWADTGGATSYKVYRNTTDDSGSASQLGTPTASAYDDTTATAGTTYYYWVKACNAEGDSGFSSSDTGFRAAAPGTPTGLTASDGTYSDKVALDWSDTSGAASYKVYRNTTDDSGSASQIGTPTASAYDDTTATAGSTYYYWVKASNAAGDSGFSSSDSGYRSTGGPSAPDDLTASDGTSASKVILDWSNVAGANSYKVYRNTTDDSGSATHFATEIISYREDTACSANTTYYYWVKACDANDDSGFSNCDTGWRAGYLSAPTGLTASDGTYGDKVALDWDDKPFADSYKVYRHTINNSGQATQIGTPSSSDFDDTTASPGTTYYYWVKGHNVYGDGEFSSYDTGYRAE